VTRGTYGLALVVLVLAAPAFGQGAPDTEKKQPPPVFELQPEGYIQLDWRGYPDSPVTPGSGRLRFDTFEVRRVRFGVDGQLRGIRYEVTVDPEDVETTPVMDAYAEIRRKGYRLRFGQFKPPGSREYGTSARNLDLLERTGVGQELAARRDIGGAIRGRGGRSFNYEMGLFAGDSSGAARRAGLTAAGRVEWKPARDIVFGFYGSEGRLHADENDVENGLQGRLSSGYRFYENVYVQGRRTRLGGDVEWSPGRWRFTGEVLRARDERKEQGVDFDDLPSVVGTGASVTTRLRFGSRRDVAVRYEYLGFDDVGPSTALASVRPRASDIRARSGQAVTFGGSWGITRWARVMANAGVEWFSDRRTAPDPGRDSGDWTLGTRLQIELPNVLRWRVR
jgi:hypothetical protein